MDESRDVNTAYVAEQTESHGVDYIAALLAAGEKTETLEAAIRLADKIIAGAKS